MSAPQALCSGPLRSSPKSRFSAVAAAICTAHPQNRDFKAPRCAICFFVLKIARKWRFSLRLELTKVIPLRDAWRYPSVWRKIASEWRCAILVHSDPLTVKGLHWDNVVSYFFHHMQVRCVLSSMRWQVLPNCSLSGLGQLRWLAALCQVHSKELHLLGARLRGCATMCF